MVNTAHLEAGVRFRVLPGLAHASKDGESLE